MSRSSPTLVNPSGRWFEWKGQLGEFAFYDKEKQQNIKVPLPFEFLVLDELSTMVGYSKRDESGYYSNEVRSVSKDEFMVKTKKGTAQIGLYKDLADVRSKGAKYAKSIYLAYNTRDGWQIGNFKAHGSALSAWIEFTKANRVQSGKVVLSQGAKETAPTGEFYPPAFKLISANDEEDSKAVELDRELQVYLGYYLAQAEHSRSEMITDTDIDPSLGLATPEQQHDYDQRRDSKPSNDDDFNSLSQGLRAEGLSQDEIDSIPF